MELGEIEYHLRQHSAIRDAHFLCIVDSTENQRLSAFIILTGNVHPDCSDLKCFLSMKLPVSMLPSTFNFMKDFPLKINGKLDRDRLLMSEEGFVR